MALPIDCIVVVYYSASVNIASTNSQSLQPKMVPALLIDQGQLLKNRDRRPVAKLDNVTLLKQAIISLAEGGNKYAISFAAGKSVNIVYNAALDAFTALSISCWTYTTGGGAGATFFNKGWNANGSFLLYNNGVGTMSWNVTGPTGTAASVAGTATNGTWHHVVGTYDGTNIILYVDGVNDGAAALTGTLTLNATTLIGSGDIIVDEARIYNVGLTQAEVVALNAGINIRRGLVSYWNFDEGSGATAKDSISGLNGTLIGSPTWYNTTLPLLISFSDSLRRKVIPKISTEIKTISETLLRKPVPKIITEVKTISEVLLRTPVPKIATEVKTISDSLRRSLVGRALAEIIAAVDIRPVRNAIRNIITEVITITDSMLRKVIPKTSDTITISDLVVRVKARLFLKLTETTTISDSTSRLYKAVRKFIEGFCSILFSGLNTV